MKKSIFQYLALAVILLAANAASAQKTWLEPGSTDFNPEDSVRIYVNLTECERQVLLNYPGDLYFWTWQPTGDDKHLIKNGQWDSSNDGRVMTKTTNPNVYYYAMIPTVFYNATVQEVYENGFAFLLKAKNGYETGTGADEAKTEDLIIKPEKPGVPKVFTMPAVPKSLKKASDTAPDTLAVSQKDFVTVFYNNKLETVPEIQNLTEGDEVHAFIRTTGSDNKKYLNVRKAQLGNDLKSKTRWRGDGLLSVTFNLGDLWVNSGIGAGFTPPPAGVTPQLIEIQFAKCNPAQPNVDLAPKAEGIFTYFVGKCQ
jgi:hypothetical protein